MRDEMKGHSYKGEFTSAIARAKKILIAAGFPWSTTTGRYLPFAGTQTTTRGVRVARVGCSDTVAVHVYGYTFTGANEAERKLVNALAIATLREAGLPFDDRGWLACGRDANFSA